MCKWPKNTLGRILGPKNSFHRKYLGLTAGLTGGRVFFYSTAMLNETCNKSPGRPGTENLGNIWRVRV